MLGVPSAEWQLEVLGSLLCRASGRVHDYAYSLWQGVPLKLVKYAGSAATCWLCPWRLGLGDGMEENTSCTCSVGGDGSRAVSSTCTRLARLLLVLDCRCCLDHPIDISNKTTSGLYQRRQRPAIHPTSHQRQTIHVGYGMRWEFRALGGFP